MSIAFFRIRILYCLSSVYMFICKVVIKTLNLHKSVFLNEIKDIFNSKPSQNILDCTFGGGGHSSAFLKLGHRVYAVDRDIKAVIYGRSLEEEFVNFRVKWSLFSEIGKHFIPRTMDCILFDLGLSSNQIHDTDYGMSFMRNAPLNMCMGRNQKTAYEVVNFMSQSKLETIINEFGEERHAEAIAKSIIINRQKRKIATTFELVDIIKPIVRSRDLHPATRTFQAIRIFINNELDEISQGLKMASQICKNGGVIAVITFHSLEDRIVKNFFKGVNRVRNLILPSRDAIMQNIRCRSAKLRWVVV